MADNRDVTLTEAGVKELCDLADAPPAKNPKRQATFERARAATQFVRREIEQARSVRRGR